MAKRKGLAEAKPVEEPKPIRPKLSDFEAGIVPGVKWGLRLRQDTKAVEKIRSWIKLGELVCPTDANPDPIIDVLILASAIKKGPPPDEVETAARPTPSKVATPAPAQSAETRPRARLSELRGIAWMTVDQVFVDGLTLPVGCRIVQFDQKSQHKFDSGDVMAARDCAKRITKETGHGPMVAAIAGCLRVIQREFLTDIKPANEQMPITRPV